MPRPISQLLRSFRLLWGLPTAAVAALVGPVAALSLGCGPDDVTFPPGADGAETDSGGAGAAGSAGSAGNDASFERPDPPDADGGVIPEDSCAEVDCGAHGVCRATGPDVTCECDGGYHSEGLSCVPDPIDPCDGVTCGEHAACDEGSCVCEDGYFGDPEQSCAQDPCNEAFVREQLINIASAELGFCEGQDSRPYMLEKPGLWCYDFVQWVYTQAACDLARLSKLERVYVQGGLPSGWQPEPGDLIKFTIQHYGIVESVRSDGRIDTLEGNYNSCVEGRTIDLSRVEYFGTLASALPD